MKELKKKLISRKLKTTGSKLQVCYTTSDVIYFPDAYCGLSFFSIVTVACGEIGQSRYDLCKEIFNMSAGHSMGR